MWSPDSSGSTWELVRNAKDMESLECSPAICIVAKAPRDAQEQVLLSSPTLLVLRPGHTLELPGRFRNWVTFPEILNGLVWM